MKTILIAIFGLFLTSVSFASDITPLSQIKEVAKQEKVLEGEYLAFQTLGFFLNAEESEGKGDGRILPFANAKILEIKDGKIKLEITGWKPENVPHAIYAQKGKRVIKALIAKDKSENIKILGAEMDEDTGQNWQQVSLIVWANIESFIAGDNSDLLNQYGQELLTQACSSCHAVTAQQHLANQWPGIMKSMKRFVSLDDDSWTFLQYYLQHNAKDMVESKH